jgi:hypothetical protein
MRSRMLLCHPSLLPPRLPSHTTDTGDRPYKCQHCGDQFARRSVLHLPSPVAPLISISPISPLCSSSQAISSRDMSTNATPTRNLSFLPLRLAARAPLLTVGPPPRSKLVTNVSSPLCLVMEPILVVSDPTLPPLLSHACPFPQPNVFIGKRDAPMSNSIARLRPSDRVIQPVPPSILQTPRTHLSAPSL